MHSQITIHMHARTSMGCMIPHRMPLTNLIKLNDLFLEEQKRKRNIHIDE
jgi:hypothetical protein